MSYIAVFYLQAKLETKALKAKRPGFTDERYNETSYYVENGECCVFNTIFLLNFALFEMRKYLIFIRKILSWRTSIPFAQLIRRGYSYSYISSSEIPRNLHESLENITRQFNIEAQVLYTRESIRRRRRAHKG